MLGTHLIPVIESSDMRGARAGEVLPATSNRVGSLRLRMASPGTADRGGHGRPMSALDDQLIHSLDDHPVGVLERGRSLMRRVYVVLIAVAVTIVLFRVLTPGLDLTSAGSGRFSGALWALPSVAGGVAVGAALVVASASRAGLAGFARYGLPGFGAAGRALSNGLAWAAIGMLAVHFTAAAFDVLPGGAHGVGAVIGGALGVGTYRLHRHSIEHDAYRTFNLVAMLLAAGSLASMSLTPTGEWWTRNFSTLGTSDDVAAACFNVAIIVSGAGMALLSNGLTRALMSGAYGLRRGGLSVMRILIALIGVGLMGVGLVPIDGDTALHNTFAASAAAAFALLCLGVQVWAARMPAMLIALSYAALALEVSAMISYDVVGLFNLTVFEIIAFTLVFAWLIALVATTSGTGHPVEEPSMSTLGRHGAARRSASMRRAAPAGNRPEAGPPTRAPHRRRSSLGVTALEPRSGRQSERRQHQRAAWPRSGHPDDPPDAVAFTT